jgi:DNA-binding transcriptional MocR family regulator
MLEDVWASRDFPVLREATRMIDDGTEDPSVHALAEATGLDLASVSRAIRALERRGLITADHRLAGVAGIQTVSGEAYLLTGLHPDGDDITDRLVDALQQAAEQVDPEEGGKLRRAAKALGDVTKSVASGVITNVIPGGIN